MKVQPLANDAWGNRNMFRITPTNDEKKVDTKIQELLPKFSEDNIDYALIDTYITRDGKRKIRTVSFYDEGIRDFDIVG